MLSVPHPYPQALHIGVHKIMSSCWAISMSEGFFWNVRVEMTSN